MWFFPKLWQTVNKSYYWLTQVFLHNYFTNTMCLKIKYWSFWKYIYFTFDILKMSKPPRRMPGTGLWWNGCPIAMNYSFPLIWCWCWWAKSMKSSNKIADWFKIDWFINTSEGKLAGMMNVVINLLLFPIKKSLPFTSMLVVTVVTTISYDHTLKL